MVFIDAIYRRKTRSKSLGYGPGAWDAIKLGNASEVANRVLNKFHLTELLKLKEQSKRSSRGQ